MISSKKSTNLLVYGLKGPEWDVFTDPKPPSSDEFLLREVEVPRRYVGRIAQVRLAERLREVNALVGFTRVEPPDPGCMHSNRPDIT